MMPLLDLHIHPSLKMYYLPYLRRSFHALVYTGTFWNPLSFQTQYLNLARSPEKVMIVSHYVIEQGFVRQGLSPLSRAISWAFAPRFYNKLRNADPWRTLIEQMDLLEEAVANTNRWLPRRAKRLKMVYRFADIAELEKNEIGLIHSVEGSHCFGYGLEPGQTLDEFWNQTEEKLAYLKSRGVCLITPAHFWENMFFPQLEGTEWVLKDVDGVPTRTRASTLAKMQAAEWQWGDPGKLSERFSRKLLEMGILLDLSHTQEHARWKVYDLCAEYKRPPVLSHVGARRFFDHEYNVSDEEIRRVHELGGIIGLILTRRWLVAPEHRDNDDGKGIDDLVDTMLYIRELTGDVACIGLGTDFDGLTYPFKDCPTPAQIGRISDRMRMYFSEAEIEAIFFGNARRALEQGWS
ncbi:MAG: hypothetical protein C4523_20560 [Myxococcales bacterium]|nr:MAG: hypothetical protein C4523_20560 [Myxococcales bacterium]